MKSLYRIFVSACLLVLTHTGFAGTNYSITINLNNVVNDKVKVVCYVPQVKEDQLVFVFPSIVPGTYSMEDFGHYIEGFKAYGDGNTKLKVKKAEGSSYTILNATKLKRVEYYVNDSWEEKQAKKFIFQPAGTNIEAGKTFVVNTFAFFGYLEGYKSLPYQLTFQKPDTLAGYSFLKKEEESKDKIVFDAANYDLLADNPILFGKPNESVFDVGGCKVHVCVYSATGKVSADKVAEEMKPIGHALEKFFGKLPVNEYYFLFYFDDPKNLPVLKGDKEGLSSGLGALEHSQCSFYYLLEGDFETTVKPLIHESSPHEFLHILTPLHLHSVEIADFNFRKPVMSEHLWMYEGVTEYFANLIQLQDSIMTLKDYMAAMKEKINQSDEYGAFSYTDMSKNIVTPAYAKSYPSVYNRAALLGMMLDWDIIEATGGKMNLKKTMFELSKIYGLDKPFNDSELIGKFVELTSPKVQQFFDDYIIGSKKPDYKAQFAKIGWQYDSLYQKSGYYFGKLGLGYDPSKKQFIFSKVENNTLQIKEGDELLAVNGTEVSLENAASLVRGALLDAKSDTRVTVKVRRGKEELELSALPVLTTIKLKNHLVPMETVTPEQTQLLNNWLNE